MGRRKVTIKDLEHQENYELIQELDHQDLVPFIMDEFQQRNPIIHLFVILNISIVTAGTIFAINQFMDGNIRFFPMLSWWILGAIVGSTLIIPIHELLHGLMYYLLGAKKVSYGANLKDFYFYATADQFIVTEKTIWPLALVPFVVIGSICLWILQMDIYLVTKCFVWGLFTLHSLNCLGDFGILSFFWANRKHKLYTYDLVNEKKSFIYKEV